VLAYIDITFTYACALTNIVCINRNGVNATDLYPLNHLKLFQAYVLALLPFLADEDKPTDGHWRAGNIWHHPFLDTSRARFIRNMIAGRLELAAQAVTMAAAAALGVIQPPHTSVVDICSTTTATFPSECTKA